MDYESQKSEEIISQLPNLSLEVVQNNQLHLSPRRSKREYIEPLFSSPENIELSPSSSLIGRPSREEIHSSIIETIGKTPLVRLNHIPKAEGVEAEILVKCEYMNPGGSIKDRVAKKMIETAELEGKLMVGDTLVEATSGNTGIGLALTSAAKGYNMVIALQENMSMEKVHVLRCMGSDVLRTPVVHKSHPSSKFSIADNLVTLNPTGTHNLNQYSNSANPQAHYDGTGEEIVSQTGGKLDYLVLGTGTGGTLTGVGTKVKQRIPGAIVVGVDPFGSVLAMNGDTPEDETGSWKLEGIGQKFVPSVIRHHVADKWLKVPDREGFRMARRLIQEEGILSGGSAGAALWGAIQIAKELKLGADKRIVVILPDSIRNYLSKFVDPLWMLEQGYFSEAEAELYATSKVLPHRIEGRDRILGECQGEELSFLEAGATIQDALRFIKSHSPSLIGVRGEKGLGVLTQTDLLSKLSRRQVGLADLLVTVADFSLHVWDDTLKMSTAINLLETRPFIVMKKGGSYIVYRDYHLLDEVAARLD